MLGGYAAWLTALAFRRRAGDDGAGNAVDAFLVNRRSSGVAAVAFSMVASCVGASATLGAAGLAFRVGTPAFWWLGSGAVGLVLMATLLARRVRDSGAATLPEMAEAFLGRPARRLISALVCVVWTVIVAAQFTALARLIAAMTGLETGWALALAATLSSVHALGGQAAIIRLDRWQTPIIAGGLVLLLAALWRANPDGTAGLRVEAVNGEFGPRDLAGYLLVIGGNYLVCPMLFGRFYSARDGRTARRGGLWAAAGLTLFAVLTTAAGLACRGLIPPDTPPDGALLAGLARVLPGTAGLAVLLALAAAVVSSADSCMVTAGSILGRDLLKRTDAGILRGGTAAVAVCAALIASLGHGILDYLLMAYGVYVGGVVMPVFVGLLLPKHRSIAPSWAVAAITVGGLLGLASAVTENAAWSVAGMATSTLLTLAGLRPRPQQPA